MLRPIISQIWIGLSKNTVPIPLPPTSRVPRTPFGVTCGSFLTVKPSHTPPVEIAPREISPVSLMVAKYFPGDSPRTVRSITVIEGDTWTIRTRPRTLSETVGECVSSIQTAAPAEPTSLNSHPVALTAVGLPEGLTVGASATSQDCIPAGILYCCHYSGGRRDAFNEDQLVFEIRLDFVYAWKGIL